MFVCLFVCLGAFAEETKLKPSIGYDIGFNYTYHAPSNDSYFDKNTVNKHIFRLPINLVCSFSNENRELFSLRLGIDFAFEGFYGDLEWYSSNKHYYINNYFDKEPSGFSLGFNLVDVEINLNKNVGLELNLVHLNYNYITQKTHCDSSLNLFLNCSDNFCLRAGLNFYYGDDKKILDSANNKLGFNIGCTFRSTNKNNTKVETENETYKNNTKTEVQNKNYVQNKTDKKGLSCKECNNGKISFYYDDYDIFIQRETGELTSLFPKEEGIRYLKFISSKLDTMELSIFDGNKIGYIINGAFVY